MALHIINYSEESKRMKITFELYTTHSEKPIILSFDKSMLMPHLYESLINEIEYNTILTEDNIIDIFAEDNITNSVLSFTDHTNKMTLEQFITLNRNFFPFLPITKNYYKIFVIDKIYMLKKHNNNNTDAPVYKNREINTNPWIDFKKFIHHTKSLIYL